MTVSECCPDKCCETGLCDALALVADKCAESCEACTDDPCCIECAKACRAAAEAARKCSANCKPASC